MDCSVKIQSASAHIVKLKKLQVMKKSAKNSAKSNKQVANAQVANTAPAQSQKLIVAEKKFGRWYVYFKGVKPSENVGCGCKTPASALRYMMLLKARHGAAISQNVYERLRFEAAKEAV